MVFVFKVFFGIQTKFGRYSGSEVFLSEGKRSQFKTGNLDFQLNLTVFSERKYVYFGHEQRINMTILR